MQILDMIQDLVTTVAQQKYAPIIANSGQITREMLEITTATNDKFGHYQCNGAMKLSKKLNMQPRLIAEQLVQEIMAHPMAQKTFANIEIAGPGFINFSLSNEYIEKELAKILFDWRIGCVEVERPLRVIIDFSSPNIAKEMHVGHLRSTIIGDCLARVLEFMGHDVLRLNHVGDWGTQFGMLIAYLRRMNVTFAQLAGMDVGDLVVNYRAAKELFDADADFKQAAQAAVVGLQGGDAEALQVWESICGISRRAFEDIYHLLGIKLLERGESFYNPYLAAVVADLDAKHLVEISDGARCVMLPGFMNRDGEPLPLIVQKSDGGYNYATTDIAALRHRVQDEGGQWLIYVTDAGQAQHFAMVFAACRLAGYYDAQRVRIDHVPFGLVLRGDGKKFKTRSGDTERLVDLLNAAISKASEILHARDADMDAQELQRTAQILGINAIKYADLANNRINDYMFSLERMLQFEGNTAAFLLYAYVRIQSIQRKLAYNPELLRDTALRITTPEETALGLHILQFNDMLQSFCRDLLPHRITDYLYQLAVKFHSFFHNCRVEGSEQQNSRLLLCAITGQTLATGLELLGLRLLDRM